MFDRLEDVDKDKIRRVIAVAWLWFFGVIAVIIMLVAAILAAIPIITLALAIIVAVLLVIPAAFIYPENSFTYKDGIHSWSWNWDWWRGFNLKRKTLTQITCDDITKSTSGGEESEKGFVVLETLFIIAMGSIFAVTIYEMLTTGSKGMGFH